MTGFVEAIGLFYKNYANFEGRSSRAEYWWPTLMQIVIYVTLAIIFFSLFGLDNLESTEDLDSVAVVILIVGFVFYLFNLLPGISVKVRRFHDLDQSGWLVLVFWFANLFIGVVEFARMIWFAFPGINGSNQYGPDPYGYDTDIFE